MSVAEIRKNVNGASGPGGRIAARLLLPFVAAADQLGLRVDAGLAQVGLTRTDLDNPEMRVNHSVAERLLKNASQLRPELGLVAAELLQPIHLDIVGYAARSQASVRGSLEHAMRYYALLHDGVDASLQSDDETTAFRISFGPLTIADAAHEFVLAVHLIAMRLMTGRPDLNPIAVHFTHARPEHLALHERVFRCPVQFGQLQNAIVFPNAVMDMPLATADSGLAQLLERQARDALQRLDKTVLLRERVREYVRQDLTGKLTAEHMAKRLGMSPRTLHRRLVDEGITYRALVDDVRREMALHCLRDRELSISEVGYLLGFTTSAAFHRAFRRWTGTTATQYRNTLTKPQPQPQ